MNYLISAKETSSITLAMVYFLLPYLVRAGTGGGSAEQSCVIPSGKAILIPVLNGECTYKDSAGSKSASDLRSCALKSDAGVTTLAATVDGVNMQGVDKYRVTSDLFNVTLAKNNIL